MKESVTKWLEEKMAKRVTVVLVTILLITIASTLAVGIYYINIESTGFVKRMNILIRGQWIGEQSSAAEVDEFVTNFPDANGILLIDGQNHMLDVISYTGWNPSKTWGGLTYSELKEVIDRFHYHGWRVILASDNLVTKPYSLWQYVNNSHREFAYVNGYGKKIGIDGSDAIPAPTGQGLFAFLKNYTSPDVERNIPAGVRFIDVYAERLGQMIQDGSFEWDGWFPIDGWTGFVTQWYFWLSPTQLFWGRWEGTNDISKWVSISYQELNEWGNSTFVPSGFPPAGWSSWNNTQRGDWIRANAPLKWYYYWQERFAKAFAQINRIFDIRPSEFRFGAMMSADRASTWTEGVVAPIGMLNFTLADRYNSFSHYWVDSEALEFHVPENALSTGLIGTKLPNAHVMTGNKIAHWGQIMPAYEWKMAYLAESITYSWVNGTRFRTADPSYFMVHAHASAPQDTDWNASIKWVKAMYSVLSRDDLTPVYLGPTYILPVYRGGQTPIYHFNYTFVQYADVNNLRNHPEFIKPEMGTLLLDMTSFADSQGLTGLKDRVLQYFANGTLNIIAYSCAHDNRFRSVWDGVGEAESLAAFHMTGTSIGTSKTYEVLTQSQLIDTYARWIASGYFGTEYNTSQGGVYFADSGFIPIVNYTDGYVSMGIYYNSTSGKFLYGRMWQDATQLPKAMVNRALYWVTDAPINSSEPLLDFKIFKLGDGTVLVPMFNMKDYKPTPLAPKGTIIKMPPLSSTLSIDASRLGLSNPSDYVFYWQSDWDNKDFMTFTDWNNIKVTLKDGADILVIKPKQTQPLLIVGNGLSQPMGSMMRTHISVIGELFPFYYGTLMLQEDLMTTENIVKCARPVGNLSFLFARKPEGEFNI